MPLYVRCLLVLSLLILARQICESLTRGIPRAPHLNPQQLQSWKLIDKLTAQEAMQALCIPESQREEYLAKIAQ
ncbi:hypothetical protein IJT17_06420 [bacterium]|nr:hypothetical protein [bacterium]